MGESLANPDLEIQNLFPSGPCQSRQKRDEVLGSLHESLKEAGSLPK